MITQEQVAEAVCEIYKEAAIILPDDIKKALQDAYDNEESDMARLNIKSIFIIIIYTRKFISISK